MGVAHGVVAFSSQPGLRASRIEERELATRLGRRPRLSRPPPHTGRCFPR